MAIIERYNTTNFIFRLLTVYSAFLFLILSLIVLLRVIFVSSIDCYAPNQDAQLAKHTNQICFLQGTFVYESLWSKKVGKEVPYPGVGKGRPGEKKHTQDYYQWIPVVFFTQAVLFYLPWLMWKRIERGQIGKIVKDLETIESSYELSINLTRLNFLSERRKGISWKLFTSFTALELFNRANCILQLIVLDWLFHNEVFLYVWNHLFENMEPSARVRLFPDQAICRFFQYGSDGTVETIEAKCALPQAKFFGALVLLVCIWLYVLVFLGMAFLFLYVGVILNKKQRLIYTCADIFEPNNPGLGRLVQKLPVENWFILNLLKSNLEPEKFDQLVKDILNCTDEEGRLFELCVEELSIKA